MRRGALLLRGRAAAFHKPRYAILLRLAAFQSRAVYPALPFPQYPLK
jgi:hypothetical protein